MDEVRRQRMAARIQEELGAVLLRGGIKDHRVHSLISFTYVTLAKDGSSARVGVSSVSPNASVESAVAGLNSAAGFLQGRVGANLKTRQTPRLKFFADSSVGDGQDIIRTIDQLSDGESGAQRDTPPQ